MPETIYWEIVGIGPIDQSDPISLGNIAVSPGETTALELKLYFTSEGNTTKLVNCAVFAALYSMLYQNVPDTSAFGDFVELRGWGDKVGESQSAGVLINMDKQNSYPLGSWVSLNSLAGFTQTNPVVLVKESVQLEGGGYHTTDGEIPINATAYFQVKIGSPVGATSGERYFSLVLDYEPFGS
jgi:hypothetical protein